MIWMLKKLHRPKDREAASLIGGRLEKQKEAIKLRRMVKNYVIIGKKRLFDLLELHYKRHNGKFLDEIRSQIKNANRIAHVEL